MKKGKSKHPTKEKQATTHSTKEKPAVTKRKKIVNHINKKDGAAILIGVLLFVAVVFMLPSSAQKLNIDLFVMSQCPAGTVAENEMAGVVDMFSDQIDVNVHFIGYVTKAGDQIQIDSLHGEPEVREDMRQACIMRDNSGKYWDYLTCLNKNYQNAEQVWESCAVASNIDSKQVVDCMEADGVSLLAENMQLSMEKNIMVSPTYHFNGEDYNGARDTKSLARTICEYITSPVCDTIEPEPVVELTIVTEEGCEHCVTQDMVETLSSILPKVNATTVNYDSEEGQRIMQKFSMKTVPLFVFDESIKESGGYSSLSPYLNEIEGELNLNTAPVSFVERDYIENKLNLFVMSQCPYGNLAYKALIEIAEKMPDIDWHVNWIAKVNVQGIVNTLHGYEEAQEDMRQICVYNYNRDKFFDYVDCISDDYENSRDIWSSCAEQAELDPAEIESCVENEGVTLLTERVWLTDKLSITDSPTFLLNNKIVFNAIDADGLKNHICAENKITGCDLVVTRVDVPEGTC